VQGRLEESWAKSSSHSLKQVGILKGKGEDASAVLAEVAGLGDEVKAGESALALNQEKQAAFLA
jgi:seryl-tRNA synthetase